MKTLRLVAVNLVILSTASLGWAAETTVQYRITGLFQPDRVDDLRQQAGVLRTGEKDNPAEIRLAEVQYDQATVTFAYDPEAKQFKGVKPDQMRDRINNLLRNVSKGAFNLFPLSDNGAMELQAKRIAVAGLDCKGCAFGAYRAIAAIDGVDRATVDFREGVVQAWINPEKTNVDALVAALKKAQVTIVTPENSDVKR